MRKFLTRFSIADLILILIGILAIIVTVTVFWKKNDHLAVYIHKNNQLWGIYPLDTDKTIVIDLHNTVQIKDGKVAVVKSDCPDKRCVKQGFGSKLPIVCLPNQLLVEIRNGEYDASLILY
jgi:hypothetical protein